MNQITHWLDASSIYGSNNHEAEELRENSGGKLKIGIFKGTRLGMLPSCVNAVTKPAMCNQCLKCFVAGAFLCLLSV
jgi:hypothetical protein